MNKSSLVYVSGELKQIQEHFTAVYHAVDFLSTCAGWKMETDGGRGKQTLIEKLLYNVMLGVSQAARLNIALGQHSWIQFRSEQSLSCEEYSHLALG